MLLRYRVREYCGICVEGGAPIVLTDVDGRQYFITAAKMDDIESGRAQLLDVRVIHDEPDPALPSEYSAPIARVELIREGHDIHDTLVSLRLMQTEDVPVTAAHPGSAVYQTARAKAEHVIEHLGVPKAVLDSLDACTPQVLLDPTVDLGIDETKISEKRVKFQDQAAALQREIKALLHFRFGFGISALVTIVMGATLGIMFRGSRALAAFGLAAIPFAIAMLLMIMGRQTAEKPGTELLGAFIIWGGLVGLAFADCVMIRLGVKR